MPTRLAVFSVLESSFATVRSWAATAGHEIALLVTHAGNEVPLGRLQAAARHPGTVFMAVPEVAACHAALADLGVDLAIVFSFPLIPQSLTALPHHGTVNLHPSLLPAYRGPNAFRSLYEGETRLGATLHHVTAEIDGGPVLAQSSEPTPEDPQPAAVAEILQRTATAVLETGVPRALADEAGEDQDRTASTAATRFREDEKLLDLSLTTHLFQCRATALILAGIQPSVLLGGEAHPLRAVRRLAGVSADQPGVVTLTSRRAIVALTNGVLELELGALPF